MFSVCVRETRNQSEIVFEASQVRKFLFEEPMIEGALEIVGKVVCDVADGQITYDIHGVKPPDGSEDQTIFVMNRFGATVAKYHI